MRVLLDTNVVLDFVLERDEHIENATRIFELLDEGTIEVFVAAITPINVFYTTQKERNIISAHEAVRFLLNAVEFCDNGRTVLKSAFDLGFPITKMPCSVPQQLRRILTRLLLVTPTISKSRQFWFTHRLIFCRSWLENDSSRWMNEPSDPIDSSAPVFSR